MRSEWRRTFFLSVLISAIASTPLSLGAVAAHWSGAGAALALWGRAETAIDLVRTFVVSFDVLVLAAWAPCALCVSRLRG
jgi:hypothetical protein